jgi:hypothetical protein
MKQMVFVFAVLLAFAAAIPAVPAQDRTLGEKVDDATLTARVKAKLVAERPGNLVSVNVDTLEGVVRLQGTVPTAEDKLAAERIARQTEGVKSVTNELAVEGRAASEPSPAASPTSGFTGRHTMTGEVTDIDAASGRVQLRTGEGELHLHFPPGALQNVKRGDRLSVELAVRPAP